MDPEIAESESPLVLARDRAERAEQRLLDALESISDGFALYDAEDRLIYVNDIYLSIYEGRRVDYPSGMTFQETIRLAACSGQIREAIGREDAWVAEREKSHRGTDVTFLRHLTDGRWVRGTETITGDGGLVVMLTDITRIKESEDALRDSEQRFRAVVEASPAAINVKDLDGRYVVSNAVHAAHHGKRSDQIVGMTERDLVAESAAVLDPGYDDAVLERDRQVAASGQPMTGIEEWVTDPEGRQSYWLTTKMPLRAPDGKTRHILTLSHDITERKKAEQALKESEARFRDFAEAASDWFWEIDENLRFIYFMDDFSDIDPRIPNHMVGKTRRELIESGDSVIDETASREDWLDHIAQLEAHRPFRNFVHVRRHADGILRYYSLSGTPHFDDDGVFKGYRGVTQHITTRKRAEQELVRREEQLSEAQRIGRMGHWRFALDKTNLEWSDELWRLYGVESSSFEPSFENVTAMIHDDERDRFEALRQRAIETAQAYCCEVRIVRPSGEVRHVRIDGRPELDDNGKTVAVFGITQDITEQKQAEAALRRSEAELSEAQRIGRIGHWRWDKESDRVERSNEACRLMGLTPVAEGFPGQEGDTMIHPDDRQQYLELFYRSIDAGKDYQTEFRLVRTDGETRVFKEIGHPQQDRRGRATGAFGIIQDITEQKQAEESLRQREAELSEAQRIGRMGHWRFALDYSNLYWSDEIWRIYGVDRSTFKPNLENMMAMYLDEDRDRLFQLRLDAIEKAQPGSCEVRILRPDGEIKHVRIESRPELDESGKTVGLFGITQDISEQKQAEAVLRQREAELSEAQRIGRLGHWRYCPEQKISHCSEELCRIYGIDPNKLVWTDEMFFGATHQEDRAECIAATERIIAECLPQDLTFRIVRSDGEVRTLRSRRQPELDADGRLVSVFGINQDVTEQVQAEEALRQRERELSEAQRIGRIGHWRNFPEDGRISLSDEMYRIYGVDPANFELTLEDVNQLIHQDDLRQVNDQRAQSFEVGDTYTNECRIVRPGGEVRHLWSEGHPEVDESGKVISVFGVSRDVTEEKQAETTLRQREQELSEAQRIGHIGHWRLSVESGRVELSEEMERLYGVDPATFDPIVESGNVLIHPEDREEAIAQREQAIQNGQAYTNECRIIRPDGAVRHLWTSAQPDFDSAGKVVSLFGVSQDTTEEKQAEQALRESEWRNRAIVEALDGANVGVCIQKFGREVNFANSALVQMAGYESVEEIVDRAWVELQGVGGTVLEEIQDDILESLKRNEHWSGELDWVRPDGTRITVDVRTVPFPGEQVIHVLTDITERKARERQQAELTEQLRQAQKMEALGQLAGGTAHEINNLLHPIITFAKLAHDRVEDEKLQHYLERIMECGRRAKEVVGDVLTFARKSPGKRAEVDMTELLARGLRFARDLVPPTIELDAAFPEQAGRALANETEVIQVILNLVKNAADALDGAGTIQLGARVARLDHEAAMQRALDPGVYLQVFVRDQGCGMTEEIKQHIFEPFFTTKPVGQGTGLGLAVAYGIVQDLGGAIAVDTKPGQGSTFTVYLETLESTHDSGKALSA